MTVDITPVMQALVALAAAALTAAAPFVAYGIKRLLRVQQNSANAAIIDMAVQRGAGLAYKLMTEAAGSVHGIVLKNAAIAQGVNHVLTSVPDTLAAFNITPDQVTRMVTGELGKLLATDPTVSPGAQGTAQDGTAVLPAPKPSGASIAAQAPASAAAAA